MPDLCPEADRRATAEFVVKLFVVHCTTVGAFFHLLHLRRDSIISIAPLLYLLCPLVLIAQHALAISLLLLWNLWAFLKWRYLPASTDTLWRPLAWLTGKFVAYERVPTMELGTRKRSMESLVISMGHIFLVVIFLAQCAGSILLYTRRRAYSPDAITFVDQMVFELGASGLLVGLLTLWNMLNFVSFRIDRDLDATKLDGTMVVIGHRYSRFISEVGFTKDGFSFLRLSVAAAVAVPVLVALGELDVDLLLQAWYIHPMSGGFMAAFVFAGRLACVVIPLATLILFKEKETSSVVVWFVTSFLVIGSTTFMVMTLGAGLQRYVRAVQQVIELQNWPVSKACPMLWKDPLADFVWWLA